MSITFRGNRGDIPLFQLNITNVTGTTVHSNVVEYVKGDSNEFIIEPKKASGAVVKDVQAAQGFQGGDIFMTEFWDSAPSVIDGTHSWVEDHGIATYNPVRYEIQRIFTAATGMNNLSSADSFVLQLDSRDRVDGAFFQTPTGKLNALSSAADVKNAIETNFNPMRMSSTAMLVDVSRNELDSKRNTFEWLVTFKSFRIKEIKRRICVDISHPSICLEMLLEIPLLSLEQ